MSKTLDTVGPLALTVEDCVLVDATMRGKTSSGVFREKPTNISIYVPETVVLEDLEVEVESAFFATLKRLENAGVKVKSGPIPEFAEVAKLAVEIGSITAAEAYYEHESRVEGPQKQSIDRRVVKRIELGKSMTANSIIKLMPNGSQLSGEIIFNQKNLLETSEMEMCQIRGKDIGFIFQEPMTALNPLKNIGDQVAEVIRIHLNLSSRDAIEKAAKILDRVGLPQKDFPLTRFPYELSGGQRQRVVIAMAVAIKPKLLIADEPSTALDVTTQSKLIKLLKDLVIEEKKDRNFKIEKMIAKFELDAVKDIKAKYLSGGQKKRVCIAMALLSNPKIVLMDEPFQGLDLMSTRYLQETIVNLQTEDNNRCCIISDHAARDLLNICLLYTSPSPRDS